MIILNGKKTAQKILKNVKKETKVRKLKLGLAVVQVGDNQVSSAYINQKRRVCENLGIVFGLFNFPESIDEQELKEEVSRIAVNPEYSGIIIQLPLPKKFNTQEILNLIPSEKDVDVLSEASLGKFYTGNLKIFPPVVYAISTLLKEYKIGLEAKIILVIGSGRLVGKPLTLWLVSQGATVSTVNSKTKDIHFFSKNADIIISGVGKPNLITGKMIKKGVVLIDAGTSIESGKLKGDIDFVSVKNKAGYVAPVPGGVGPMTIACLINNLLKLNNK